MLIYRGGKSKVSFEVAHTQNFWEGNGEGRWEAEYSVCPLLPQSLWGQASHHYP